jgi:hypothetical protein
MGQSLFLTNSQQIIRFKDGLDGEDIFGQT